MDITLEPTLAPNEFRVVEWDTTFQINGQPPLSLENAKDIILKFSEDRAWIDYVKSVRHKHIPIL